MKTLFSPNSKNKTTSVVAQVSPLFPKSSLNRIKDATHLPYSLILANKETKRSGLTKVIRANMMEAISTIKGAFENKGFGNIIK